MAGIKFKFQGEEYNAPSITFGMAVHIEEAYGKAIKAVMEAQKAGEVKAVAAMVYGVVHSIRPNVKWDDVLKASIEDLEVIQDEEDVPGVEEEASDPSAPGEV